MSEDMFPGCLEQRDYEANEFKISVVRRKASKASSLDMKEADSRLLRELLSKDPLESAFEGSGIHQCQSF